MELDDVNDAAFDDEDDPEGPYRGDLHDILELALYMADVFEQDPERFPSPPMPPAELRAAARQFMASLAAQQAALRALAEHHAAKNRYLLALKERLRVELWYAEMDVHGERVRLSGLGWGGRPGATDREPPGPVRDVQVGLQDGRTLVLEWKPSPNGGPAAEYWVQRRKPGRPWRYVGPAVDNDCLLVHQPRGIELGYRVVALNRAGAAAPSDAVRVVL